jgi:hypothetical protein
MIAQPFDASSIQSATHWHSFSLIKGPTSVSKSVGSPTFSWLADAENFSENTSAIFLSQKIL